jgi:hypothetical protein
MATSVKPGLLRITAEGKAAPNVPYASASHSAVPQRTGRLASTTRGPQLDVRRCEYSPARLYAKTAQPAARVRGRLRHIESRMFVAQPPDAVTPHSGLLRTVAIDSRWWRVGPSQGIHRQAPNAHCAPASPTLARADQDTDHGVGQQSVSSHDLAVRVHFGIGGTNVNYHT